MNDSNDLKRENCPDRECVLSVVEGRDIPSDQAGIILNHLTNCRECRHAISFVCAAIAVEKRRQTIKLAPCWSRILSTIDLWANRAMDEVPDALAATATKRALVFVSKQKIGDACIWRADVDLPAPDDPEGELHIVVQDGNGNPLHGRFRLCGIECDVEAGKTATISIKEFRANHSLGGVAFSESGKPFAEGVPVISSIL